MNFATLFCQHRHIHEGAQCNEADCRVCCTELRECDVAKFTRHVVATDKQVALNRDATGVS